MRLVSSSVPGAVERDAALRLLSERAVLTRMLCRELFQVKGRFADRRAYTALSILLNWIAEKFPGSQWLRPTDGLDQMPLLEDARSLLAEIKAGTQVADAYFLKMNCDLGDKELLECLESYWAKHAVAVRPPWFVDDEWPSMESDQASTTDR